MPEDVAKDLSRYLWAVRLPPQNSAGAKKLGGRSTARKRPIGEG
ncbi:hypothetical protein [Bacillus paramycoides]|nr:hypothetical protein [Bacillus paramycoides]